MRNERGPLPAVLGPLSWCAARAYEAGARIADRRHRSRGSMRVSVPVISVGNITAGGTGKTPFTRRIAESIIAAGGSPAIALRGYRATSTGGSDEAREYQESLPGVPVLVGADRIDSITQALEEDPQAFDCVLLDDGFQHRRLHRDLDIVLVDSSRPGVFGDLLPNGWLREPVSALGRADCLVRTNHHQVDCPDPLEHFLMKVSGTPVVAHCHHDWSEIILHHPEGRHEIEPAEAAAQYRKVMVISGLGNPGAMIRSVQDHGFTLARHLRHRDHASYSDADGRAFLQCAPEADAILISAKDWVKLRELPSIQACSRPILVPQVRIEFSLGASSLSGLLSGVCGRSIAL